ncbi:phosphate ABC transporter permease subunit PstC [Methanogenium organophilum]|uniref:Phosphate transport system permease protein n=1 Tax=Methanogenium organophilum TaxID=2199 RepID=A0A9X9S4A6_METOG|nr:phosphate ABC transporter permease subunit PstC [Methanogenium organophilum]WAI01222.1 phosphate ABC transporter permease subunit PstC [Methanogenium organophilum]
MEFKNIFFSRQNINSLVRKGLFVPTFLSALIFIAIAVVLLVKSIPILSMYPITDLLFSSIWKPMSGDFGFLPFIMGTLWVTILSMIICIPISLFCALYLSEYAPKRVQITIQPFIDLLAGIPSVVYGLFGIILIVPLIRDSIAPFFNITSSGYTVLSGGIVLAIMVFPILISVSFEVFQAVPFDMREASLSCGATNWEMVKHVVITAGYPGLIAALILGFSRAFGETMAVLMVVGNVPIIPQSVFDPAYPIPALIANNYGEMMSIPMYDSALMFAAFILLIVVIAFTVLSKYMLIRIKARLGS